MNTILKTGYEMNVAKEEKGAVNALKNLNIEE